MVKDKDNLTQKEKNIVSNIKYRKDHDIKKWHLFWIIFGILLVISVISLAQIVMIPLESYMLTSLMTIIIVNTNFLASTIIAVEYDPLRRAVCHMGRLKSYHGFNNMKSVILWIGWGFSTGILAFLYGKLMLTYYFNQPILIAAGLLGCFGTIVAIMVVLIPIDVARKFHLFSSLIFFLIPFAINILIFIYLIFNNSVEYSFIPILQWIFAVLYAIGYVKRYIYTAILQKTYLLLSLFSVYIYINFFSVILL